jgi:lipooligosaccharide transport system ATP-binding protein
MWERLQRLLQQGKSILLTTHFMDEAERLCDRIAIVDAGRVIALGTPPELLAEFGVPHLDDVFVKLAGRRLTESGWTEPLGGSVGTGGGGPA